MAHEEIHGPQLQRHRPQHFLIGKDGKIEQIWDAVRVKGHAAETLSAAASK